MTHEELIAALTQATEPDRYLDEAILLEVFPESQVQWFPPRYAGTTDLLPVVYWKKPHPYAGMCEPLYKYTADINCALTLLPPNADWQMNGFPTSGIYHAFINTRSGSKHIEHSELAIAFCIAVLEVRKSLAQ